MAAIEGDGDGVDHEAAELLNEARAAHVLNSESTPGLGEEAEVEGAAGDSGAEETVDEATLMARLEYLRHLRARVTELKERTERQRALLREVEQPTPRDEVAELRLQLAGLRMQVQSRTSELQRLRRRCADVSKLAASVSRVIETRAVLVEAQRSLSEVAARTQQALAEAEAPVLLAQQGARLQELITQVRNRRLVDQVPIEVLTEEMPDTMCCICQDDFDVGDATCTLPCQHVFHTPCIQAWIIRRATCPLCKEPLPDVDGEPPPPVPELEPGTPLEALEQSGREGVHEHDSQRQRQQGLDDAAVPSERRQTATAETQTPNDPD